MPAMEGIGSSFLRPREKVGIMKRRAGLGSIHLLVLVMVGGALAHAAAQPAPEIALDPAIECWFNSEFPILGANITPPGEVVRSRLYFRCSLYPDYYFVDLAVQNGTYHGVAPQAEENCPRVHYYVEALTRDFSSARTEERIADVASPNECRRRNPAAAWFTGQNPNITLGSTVAGPQMAPGFKSIGIVSFLTSSGAVVAASGGISGGVVAGIAAAGGAAVGVGFLATGSDSSTTTSAPIAVVTTTTPPTTTAPPPATTTVPSSSRPVRACFTLDPPSGVVKVNENLRVDGRCSQGENLSFSYNLGDGRVRDGEPFITPQWSTPGYYTLSLTVTGEPGSLSASQAVESDTVSRQIQVQRLFQEPHADFTARALTPFPLCLAEFDGSPSTGDIASFSWELDLENVFGQGVIALGGRVVTYDWKNACFDSEGTSFLARLTVVGLDGTNDSITKRLDIFQFPNDSRSIAGSFTSQMLDADGARGQIAIEGGQSYSVSGKAPSMVRYSGRSGRNTLEAILTSATAPVEWRFDFSGAQGFTPGSLRLVSGQEVSRDAYSIVVRLADAGARARIEYRLEP
jgi:hypothetical protein